MLVFIVISCFILQELINQAEPSDVNLANEILPDEECSSNVNIEISPIAQNEVNTNFNSMKEPMQEQHPEPPPSPIHTPNCSPMLSRKNLDNPTDEIFQISFSPRHSQNPVQLTERIENVQVYSTRKKNPSRHKEEKKIKFTAENCAANLSRSIPNSPALPRRSKRPQSASPIRWVYLYILF